jgi:hypothetical protein
MVFRNRLFGNLTGSAIDFSEQPPAGQPTDGLSTLYKIPFSDGKASLVDIYRRRAVGPTSVPVF